MTEPTPIGDATSAILVAVTKIDGKLDTALAVQAIHSTDITDLKRDVVSLGNRTTVLETVRGSDETHSARTWSARAVIVAACILVVTVIGTVVAVLSLTHGG